MTEPEQAQLDAIVDKFLDDASEFCDSVRVFTNLWSGTGNETSTMTVGRGNILAQQAQVRDWLIRQDEMTRRNTGEREDDDGEKEDP